MDLAKKKVLDEILLNVPNDYEDYRTFCPPGEAYLHEGQWICMTVRLLEIPREQQGSKPRWSCLVTDGVTKYYLNDFGKLKFSDFKSAQRDQILAVRVQVKEFNGRYYLSRPEIIPQAYRGLLVPKYTTRKGVIAASKIRDLTRAAVSNEEALNKAAALVMSHFPGKSVEDVGRMLGRSQFSVIGLLKAMHSPQEAAHGALAVDVAKRLAALAIIDQARTSASRVVSVKSVISVDPSLLNSLIEVMPFKLTGAQAKCVERIALGLRSAHAMNMLLSGDVGTGKTAAYLLPAVAAKMAGAKVGVMIPNLVLAKQIEGELKSWFPDVETVFLGGSGPKLKTHQLDGNPIVIGTTAMLHQMPKLGWVPDFLVVDEQQKTSVEQRNRLLGEHTNLLEATATCMPRTKALIEHGAIDVAVLNEFPVKKTIHTQIVGAQGRVDMFTKLKEVVAGGDQVAVIYPLVDGEKDEDVRRSVESAALLWEKVFPGEVGCLHGRMDDEGKLDTIARMKSQSLKVLVASTVIEIGVTIPALKAVMVVHAEKYGVSTLHQIRGRVARHGGEGWCYLFLPDEVAPETLERLELLEKFKDGFELAEADMQLRGFGDLSQSGSSQHGASRAIFYGITLMPSDVQSEMDAMIKAGEVLPQ